MSPFGRFFGITGRAVARLYAVAFAMTLAAPARAQTPVQFGDIITEPGVYFLAGNQSGSGRGIDIQSDDVTLLLLRFTLRGDGTDYGILSLGYDRLAVYGGRVTNFQNGIYLSSSDESTLNGVRVDHNSGTGVHVQNSYENWFVRLRVDHNHGDGIFAADLYEARFVSILTHDNNGDGMFLRNFGVGMAQGTNKVRLCWSAANDNAGIHVLDAHDYDISRNECVGNGDAGIALESSNPGTVSSSGPVDATRDNRLTSNWCVFNRDGIFVGSGATSNTMTNNTALANFENDMVDENDALPCANAWFLNFFFTKDGAGAICIF